MTGEHRRRILVVDDEPDVRSFFRTALADAGFEVVEAADGFEALDRIREAVPDLISLDLMMPRHSGVRFYRELQKDPSWAKIPVLVVTAHAV